MREAQFTDDDVGKTVVDDEDSEIGTVSAVEHGTAYVELDPGVMMTETTALDWHDIDDEDGYHLYEEAVESVTDDRIRLQSDL